MKANAAALKVIRERSGFSQTSVAEGTGIDRPNYAHIESGRRPGSDEQLVAIARFLDVPILAIVQSSAHDEVTV